jgi:hypothetical protein
MFTLSLTRITESLMRKLKAAATDEFGVKQLNVLYNRAADLCFCFLETPNRKQLENIMRNLYRSQTLVDFIKTLSYCKDLVRLNFY